MCAARPAPGRTSAAQMIRPLATIAQVVVERFNYEINIRVQIPVRAALFKLERLRLLDKTIHAHVGAIQFLALPLMQYGCDLLRLAWNQHNRRIIRGVAGTGGRPEDLRRTRPHPGHQIRSCSAFKAASSSGCVTPSFATLYLRSHAAATGRECTIAPLRAMMWLPKKTLNRWFGSDFSFSGSMPKPQPWSHVQSWYPTDFSLWRLSNARRPGLGLGLGLGLGFR